jgi:hypothetical protein
LRLFGLLSLTVALAVAASLPLANLLALGYLAEASGRVARSGRWRDGVFGLGPAAWLGALAGCGWVCTLPLRLVSGMRRDALLLSGTGPETAEPARSVVVLTVVLGLLTAGLTVLLLLAVVATGHVHGRESGTRKPFPATVRDGLLVFLAGLRLPRLLRLGAISWLGGAAWLALPGSILCLATRVPGNAAILPMLLGTALLVPAATGLPLVQAKFAATGRWQEFLDRPGHRLRFRHAPGASAVAVAATLAASLPLYLLKIELPPRELVWLPGLFFIGLLWPARILSGWAVRRAEVTPRPRAWPWTTLARLVVVPLGLAYGIWLWLMQYLSWSGPWEFLHQHAFLLPAPASGW